MHGRTDATAVEASGTFTIGDLEVHRLGFGAMRITGRGIWGEPDDPGEARRLLRREWFSATYRTMLPIHAVKLVDGSNCSSLLSPITAAS